MTQAPDRKILEKNFPEWMILERLIEDLSPLGRLQILGHSHYQDQKLPILGMAFGSQDPRAPTLGLFGGVHGLERIGSQVVLALMKSFSELALWDEVVKHSLSKMRLFFVPIVNPFGILHRTRCNPNGVDLMRNAPVESADTPKYFLMGGQTLSSKLPWYRGTGRLEPESQAILDACKQQFFQSKCAITIDCHSGFGFQDQLWFPYAKTLEPFYHLPEMYSLFSNFQRTYPHHFYKIEPQAYTTHGDMWDYIYDLYRDGNKGTYLPLCLEMGSWLWVRKNPFQLFYSLGHYNPIKPHRQKRVLRRHTTLFDFLMRSLVAHSTWAENNSEQRQKFASRAQELWYAGPKKNRGGFR